MSDNFLIHVTDRKKTLNSKSTGKPFTLTEAWVQIPGDPYPSKLEVFGDIAPGKYAVPAPVTVHNGRLQISLDMDAAKPARDKGE